MKKCQQLLSLLRWLIKRSPKLETVQGHVDTWSQRLFWLSVLLSVLAGLVSFFLVLCLAVLPYITLTHTTWAGLVVGIIVAIMVYFATSKPAQLLERGSNGLWLTQLFIKLVSRWNKQQNRNDEEPVALPKKPNGKPDKEKQ